MMSPELAMAIRRARWCGPPVLEPVVAEEPELAPAPTAVPRRWPWFEMVPLHDWHTPLVIAEDASLEERVEAVIGLLNRRLLSIPFVQRATARVFDISVADLIGHDKKHKFAVPRGIAITIAWRLTNKPTTEIGRRFGARDASTVWHATASWRGLVEPAIVESRRQAAAIACGQREEMPGNSVQCEPQ